MSAAAVCRRLVGGLVALTLVAGVWSAAVQRDRQDAPIHLYAVPPVASGGTANHEGNPWTSTVFVLLLGSDERPGLEGARADGIHLVGLNPGLGRATIVNIPRDTWVDIPGQGQGRVNSAFSYGGPALMAETVHRLTGARPLFVLTTTFPGLTGMVDRLGGLDVHVNQPMDDAASGARFPQGVVHMDGGQVLAFSRNRNVRDGDLVRTANQGQVLQHALGTLRSQGTRPADVLGQLDVLLRGVAVHGVGPVDLYRLGRAALAIDPANVRNITMPAQIGMINRLSVVLLRLPDATGFFQDFADDGVLQGH